MHIEPCLVCSRHNKCTEYVQYVHHVPDYSMAYVHTTKVCIAVVGIFNDIQGIRLQLGKACIIQTTHCPTTKSV